MQGHISPGRVSCCRHVDRCSTNNTQRAHKGREAPSSSPNISRTDKNMVMGEGLQGAIPVSVCVCVCVIVAWAGSSPSPGGGGGSGTVAWHALLLYPPSPAA